MTLTEFLLARIAYDEELAARLDDEYHWGRQSLRGRMLAECAAKRRVIGQFLGASRAIDSGAAGDDIRGECYAWEQALRILVLPYADHPDYQQRWALPPSSDPA